MFYSAAKFECSPFFLLFVSSAGCGCCLTRHPLKLNLSVLKLFNGELRADSHFRAVVAAAPIVTFLPPIHRTGKFVTLCLLFLPARVSSLIPFLYF
jgi:hypothetical protein